MAHMGSVGGEGGGGMQGTFVEVRPAFRGQGSMRTLVIKVTEFKYEVGFGLGDRAH